jgi:hypothetical protein
VRGAVGRLGWKRSELLLYGTDFLYTILILPTPIPLKTAEQRRMRG